MKAPWRASLARLGQRMRERPLTNLFLHFFRRLFAGEALSAETDLRLGMGGILMILSLPGAFLSILLLPKYSSLIRWITGQLQFDFNTASIPDKYMLLTLSMTVTGIVAALKWDGLFPDRLDSVNLLPLPVTSRQILAGKLGALFAFVGLFIVALNGAATILFPLVVLGDQESVNLGLRFTTAHALASAAGCAFMFFLVMALAGLLLTILPYRWFAKVSTLVQSSLVVALVALLLFTPEIEPLGAEVMAGRHPMLRWLPTIWYLGLYQRFLGGADREASALALRAIVSLAAAILASLIFYGTSYRRYFRRIPEMTEALANGPSRLRQIARRGFDNVALGSGFDRACFHFAMKTIFRSPRHRLVLSGFVGLGLAVAIQDAAADRGIAAGASATLPTATQLSAVLAICFFLVCGLIFVFKLPAELPANWAFRVVGEWRSEQSRGIARKLMLVFLLPLILAAAAVYSVAWGARLGIAHSAYVFLASLLLMNALLLGFRKIPFTCSYSAGKQNPGLVLALYLVAFLFFSGALSSLERWALSWPSIVPFLLLLGAFVCVLAVLRHHSRGLSREEASLIFEDCPDPVVHSMDLR